MRINPDTPMSELPFVQLACTALAVWVATSPELFTSGLRWVIVIGAGLGAVVIAWRLMVYLEEMGRW